MKRLEPTFLRRFQVYADIEGKNKSVIQEPVAITLGFKGPIDPDSGMVINLADIDAWIEKFQSKIKQKTYPSRWEFCKQSKIQLAKLINKKEFTQSKFNFQDFFIKHTNQETHFGWQTQSLIQAQKKAFRSDITVTFQSTKKNQPPTTPAQEKAFQKKLKTISLDKTTKKENWNLPNSILKTFEYFDPTLNTKVKIELNKDSKKSKKPSRT